MGCRFALLLGLVGLLLPQSEWAQSESPQNPPQENGGDFSTNAEAPKLPTGVILVKGAVASASDNLTPLPESGSVGMISTGTPAAKDAIAKSDVASTGQPAYVNDYFGLWYPLPAGWVEQYQGPPPSDSGRYVLAELAPAATSKGVTGSILITAQDLFFALTPTRTVGDLVRATAARLKPEIYRVERQPTETKIANRSFVRLDYMSPAAGLHWSVLATQIRCHAVEFVFTSRDTSLLERLVQGMEKMKLPAEAGATSGRGGNNVPVCVEGYASSDNVLDKVDPVLSERHFNALPARIIIGRDGRVKHVHILSAFPDQAKVITDALMQWTFRPHRVNGQPMEVETGLMFGNVPRPKTRTAAGTVD